LTYTAGAGDVNQTRTLHWSLNRYAFVSSTTLVFPTASTALDGSVTFSSGVQLIGIHQTVTSFNQFPALNALIATSGFTPGIANPFAGGDTLTATAGTNTAAGPFVTDGYVDFMPTIAGATIELTLPGSSSTSLVAPVPEPTSLALCAASGGVALAGFTRRVLRRSGSGDCRKVGQRDPGLGSSLGPIVAAIVSASLR
jgi:hypothetical protein